MIDFFRFICLNCGKEQLTKYKSKKFCNKNCVSGHWNKLHRDKINITRRKYYIKNIEKERARSLEWQHKNVDEVKKRRKNNQWKASAYLKEKIRNDSALRVNYRVSRQLYDYLKRNKLSKGKKQWEKIVGYTLEELMIHIESNFVSGMSWDNYGPVWHIDHIIPKRVFKIKDFNSPELKQCWALSNLQPLFAKDNFRKGGKVI